MDKYFKKKKTVRKWNVSLNKNLVNFQNDHSRRPSIKSYRDNATVRVTRPIIFRDAQRSTICYILWYLLLLQYLYDCSESFSHRVFEACTAFILETGDRGEFEEFRHPETPGALHRFPLCLPFLSQSEFCYSKRFSSSLVEFFTSNVLVYRM